MLTRQAWSPYVAGIVIGLLQIPAFLLIETALGASSSYVTIGGMFASWIRPVDPENRLRRPPRRRHRQELVAGRARHRHRHRCLRLNEAVGREARGDLAGLATRARLRRRRPKRYAVAFIGGFVLLLGARIADGCTSGHGLSGMAQLSVGSTVAVAAMFAGGIATAMLLLRRI